MKIVFMGTPDIAVTALEKIIESPHEVIAVVTQPDRQRGRGKKISFSPVKEVAVNHEITVLQPEKARSDDFINEIEKLNPDLIVVEAYGQILNKKLLDIPKYGAINIHVSLLPKYRGAAPINWSIIRGEKKTGVTIIQMDEGLDTGDILGQKEFEILDSMTAGELHDKMMDVGADLVLEVIEEIENGTVKRIKQNHDEHTYAPMMNRETGHIDFNKSAWEVHNLIRGVIPWPGAWMKVDGDVIKVWESEVISDISDYIKEYKNDGIKYDGVIDIADDKNGKIISVDKNGILIVCSEGFILIKEIQVSGKRRMEVGEYIKGNSLPLGEVVE